MFVLIAWWELIRGNGWGWLWRVSDWWRHLRKHLGINASNYFKYLMGRYKWGPRGACMLSLPPPSLLKFIHLLHLNQVCVQYFIRDLTYAHASTL